MTVRVCSPHNQRCPTMLRTVGVFVLLLAYSNGMPPGPSFDPDIVIPASPSSRSGLHRASCMAEASEQISTTSVNTSLRLSNLRKEMRNAGLTAYIITTSDDHQSEYIANHDKRREFISGFSGSSGDAVVTLTKAALWTDSRYYLLAEQELDCNWQIMRSGEVLVPSIQQWLVKELLAGDKVSADPRITSYSEWATWNSSLSPGFILELENLVDKIWLESDGRPPYPNSPVFIHDIIYAGRVWEEKLTAVREVLIGKSASVLVVTALDEIAWALNLRGNDIPFTPIFHSYLLIGLTWATLYLPPDKITDNISQHCISSRKDVPNVSIKPYADIWADLPVIGQESSRVLLPSPVSYAKGASYLIYHLLPQEKVIFSPSPLLTMKDFKNNVEAWGMKQAHIRDAVALCQLLYDLEKGVSKGEYWDELSVVEKLDQLRSSQPLSNGSSFGTIAAFGSNAALPHYSPTAETNKVIDTSGLFMLDSGGQYYDGTTDVTRTIHLGTPTKTHQQIYTHLLMGCINIASTKFPKGQTLGGLEILIRAPLYSLGLNYGHGSTHGIGAFLAVHEAFNTTYHENFFGSQEPGYYRDNEFGMRLENIVTVIPTNFTPFEGREFLTFESVTLVPYERKLIDVSLLSHQQIQWLDLYHARVQELVGKEMLKQGRFTTYNWLYMKTRPLQPRSL